MSTLNHKKQYYPAFLKEFKGDAFDASNLGGAFMLWKSKKSSATPESAEALFREFQIDEAHWNFHQRILHDDVLFRLIAEGYIHPKVHPVGSIYNDAEFYAFVFPFIHTAILKKMATAIENGNLEAVKLLEQWTEPFGTLFRDSFYRMVEYNAEELLKQLASLKLSRKTLPFDTYSKVNAALMHMLNRLPERWQPLRDRFAIQLMDFAAWLRNEMKVYAQPTGILTRLKLLNVNQDVHAQRNILVTQWENEKEAVSKEKFSMNHLIWIIPAVLIGLFFIWRQTDMGRSVEDRMEDREEELAMEQAALDSLQKEIDAKMNSIDLNGIVTDELIKAAAANTLSGTPADAATDSRHLDNGKPVYQDWLLVGRNVFFTDQNTLNIDNLSKCDAVVFVRQKNPPYLERAYFLRAGRSIAVQDEHVKLYTVRVYAGSAWTDSLVTAGFDQTMRSAGIPESVTLPSSTELRGRFLYPVKSLSENLKPVSSDKVFSYYDYDGVPTIVLEGDHDGIYFQPRQ